MVAALQKDTMNPGTSKRWNSPFENEAKPMPFVPSDCRQLRKRDPTSDSTPPLLMYVGRFIDSLFNTDGPGMMKVAAACMQDTSICALEDTTFDEAVDWKSETSTPEWLPDIIMHTKGDDDVSMDLTFDGSYMIDPRSKELLGIQQSGKRVYRIPPLLDVNPGASKKLESAPSDENSLELPILPPIRAQRELSLVSSLPSSHDQSNSLLQHSPLLLRDQQTEPREPASRSSLPTNTDSPYVQQPQLLSESDDLICLDQRLIISDVRESSPHFRILALDNEPSPAPKTKTRGIWPVNRNRRSSSKDPAAKGKGLFRFSDRRLTTDRATLDVNRFDMYSSGNEASSEVTSTRNDNGVTRSVDTQSIARESIPSYSPSIRNQDSTTPSLDNPGRFVVTVKSGGTKSTSLTARKSDKLTETSPLGLAILQNISSSGSEMDGSRSDAGFDCKGSCNTDQAQGSARRRIRRIFSKESAGSDHKRVSFFSKGKPFLRSKKVEERQPTES